MATDELMSRALEVIGDDLAASVEAIHRLTDLTGVAESMVITEVADFLDISPHTLRYYERAGLVDVARDHNGHRVYDAAAVRRLVFITRMRLSGMPMRDLQHYARTSTPETCQLAVGDTWVTPATKGLSRYGRSPRPVPFSAATT